MLETIGNFGQCHLLLEGGSTFGVVQNTIWGYHLPLGLHNNHPQTFSLQEGSQYKIRYEHAQTERK